jgi:hypothetical protein
MSIIRAQKWFLTTARYYYLSFTSSWNRTRSCSTFGSSSSVRRWSLNRETGQQQQSTRSSYPRIFPFSGARMKGLGEGERLALFKWLAIISSRRRKSPFFLPGIESHPSRSVVKAQLQRVFYFVSCKRKESPRALTTLQSLERVRSCKVMGQRQGGLGGPWYLFYAQQRGNLFVWESA